MLVLKHIITSENVTFTLENNSTQVSVSNWADYPIGGCSKIVCWLESDEEGIRHDDVSVSVPTALIAGLSDEMAADLCLPKPASVVIHIRNHGLITQPNFSFSYQWNHDSRAQPIAGAKRIGCFLKIGDSYARLPFQIYKIADGIDKINETLPENISDRLLKWHEIESYFPSETSRSITIESFLSSTKVYSAHAFELIPKQGLDGIDFDPVLLKPRKNDIDDYYQDENNFDRLLSPIDQDVFADLFQNGSECKSSYSLGTGRYLILSDQLSKTLQIIHKIKKSPIEKRLEFLKNPRAALSEEGFSDVILNKVFSDRIEGYGEKRIKVIPWIKIEGQEWLPSDMPPRWYSAGDVQLDLSENECIELEKKVREAIINNEKEVEHNNVKIPATLDTLVSIAQLNPTKSNKSDRNSLKAKDENKNIKKCVLYVKDNFSDVKYQIRYEPREGVSRFNELPIILKTALDPHQLDGVNWMVDNYIAGASGILLADDMGLGKTLQSLTFLAWLRQNILNSKIQHRPILIVAPTGLLKNWQEEHDKHLHEPGLGEVVSAYGTDLNQLKDKSNPNLLVKPLKIQKLKEANWILTTYETLSNYQTSFASISYAAVIFDEMQKIKTPNTRNTEAAQAINADFIVGMTGTPIETRLADLWCLIDTLQPGRLGTLREFSAKYEKDFSQTSDLKNNLTKSDEKFPSLMLRRMKGSVLKGLPGIYHHHIEETMPKTQADHYKKIVDDVKKSLDDGRQLEALQHLRSASLHPHKYQTGINDEAFIAESARLRGAFRVLDEIRKKNEKALIFIEFRDWHQSDFLPSIIRRRYKLKHNPMVISGAIKTTDRQERVNRFQKDTGEFDVMLISPRAGGVGLTLTRANHVIHLSRWWNPAVEDQCTDRAYRKGQNKDVHVYYPMARHPEFGEKSFDYCLNELLIKRRTMSRDLLTPPVCKDDVNQLKKSVFQDVNKSVADRGNLSINDIDCLEPHQFEDWIANQCSNFGIVKKTKRSWDGGADIVIENKNGCVICIIQCKHTSQEDAPLSAVTDLLRASETHNAKKAKLIAVTNASRYSDTAALIARQNDIFLLSRDQLVSLSDTIFHVIEQR